MPVPDRRPGEAGVTIVELMITCALLLIVLMATFSALDAVSTSQAFQSDRTQTLDDMRGVLNRMTKDLRQATSVTDCTGTPNTITYSTAINGTATTIIYTATGTNLTRKVGSATAFTVLKSLASTSIFTCVSASDVTGVQWVEISLSVSPARRPNTTLVLDSEVNLRNRTSSLTGAS